MDRNNNPETHKQILNAILEAAEPTDIYNTVDRTAIPFGGSRPLQLVKHILACAGVQFIYRPYAPDWKQFGAHQREAIPRVPEAIV
jgi:hypothetical protein